MLCHELSPVLYLGIMHSAGKEIPVILMSMKRALMSR